MKDLLEQISKEMGLESGIGNLDPQTLAYKEGIRYTINRIKNRKEEEVIVDDEKNKIGLLGSMIPEAWRNK